MQVLSGKERLTVLAALILTLLSGFLAHIHFNAVVVFVLTGMGLALILAGGPFYIYWRRRNTRVKS